MSSIDEARRALLVKPVSSISHIITGALLAVDDIVREASPNDQTRGQVIILRSLHSCLYLKVPSFLPMGWNIQK